MRKSILALLLLLVFPAKAQIFEVTGNAAALPLFSLDVGAGIAVGKGHTLSAEILMRPVYPQRIFYVRAVCRKYRTTSHAGFFAGLSGGYHNFSDGERHGEGIALGASCGYRFILAKRLDLSIEAGATLTAVRDTRRKVVPDPYLPDFWETRERLLLMPFPLSINIHYLF